MSMIHSLSPPAANKIDLPTCSASGPLYTTAWASCMYPHSLEPPTRSGSPGAVTSKMTGPPPSQFEPTRMTCDWASKATTLCAVEGDWMTVSASQTNGPSSGDHIARCPKSNTCMPWAAASLTTYAWSWTTLMSRHKLPMDAEGSLPMNIGRAPGSKRKNAVPFSQPTNT